MPSPSSASENAQADERVDTADATRHKRLARRRRDVPWPRTAHINCPCCRRCGVGGSVPPPRRDLLLSHMVLFFLRRCPLHLKEGAGGWALIWRDRHRPRLGLPLGSAQKREKGRQNSWLAGVRRTNGRSATRRRATTTRIASNPSVSIICSPSFSRGPQRQINHLQRTGHRPAPRRCRRFSRMASRAASKPDLLAASLQWRQSDQLAADATLRRDSNPA